MKSHSAVFQKHSLVQSLSFRHLLCVRVSVDELLSSEEEKHDSASYLVEACLKH